jgi:hypothetical protein
VTKARIQSWQDFVTKEGNKKHWGIIYRTITGKIRREETANATRRYLQLALNRRSDAVSPPTRRPRIFRHAGTSHDQAEHGDPPERRIHCRVPHGRALRSSQKTDEREVPWSGHDRGGSYSARLGSARPGNIENNQRLPRLGDLPKDMEIGKPNHHPKRTRIDRSSPKSYRPICLISMVDKLLERLMATRMSTLLHQHELPSNT